MKKTLFYFFLTLALIGFNAYSCGSHSNSKNEAESQNEDKFKKSAEEARAQYLVDTYSSTLYEQKAAEVAKTRAAHKNVKTFATKIANANKKLNDEIKKIATSKQISLPDDLTPSQHDKLQNMMEKRGSEFDRDFIDQMVTYCKNDVNTLENVSSKESDADIKTFASNSLPVVRGHLDSASIIQGHLKKSK